nr:acyltransferase family protein [Oenococcus oeni]
MSSEKIAIKRKYLYGVDLMRLLFILGVLIIHTSTVFTYKFQVGSASFLTLGSFHMPMHFTRMGFMFISGLVLFLNSYNRPMHLIKFWKRRYFWVLIPYFFGILFIIWSNTILKKFQPAIGGCNIGIY